MMYERNNDLCAFNVSLQTLSAMKFKQVLTDPNITKKYLLFEILWA
jgi:hypothetical protein